MEVRNNRLCFGGHTAGELVERYGSPLFVYEEAVLRERCRELRELVAWGSFRVNYSVKANSSVALLKIIREEGLCADAMSPGEILLGMEAGFGAGEILYIPNNVSKEEMRYAVERGVRVSLDSLTQLGYYGEVDPGGSVFVRINPGIGDGHHEKVVTAGESKFGIPTCDIGKAKEIAGRHGLRIAGINMHIGSFFLKPDNYMAAIRVLLGIAEGFEGLQFIDFGGGLGIPYRKGEDGRFPMGEFAAQLRSAIEEWQGRGHGRGVTFMLEPGRYPVAECGTALTTVHSTKESFGTRYVGTDLGFNLLIRPMLYGAYHEVLVADNVESSDTEVVTVCGNICESGDLVCEGRRLPKVALGFVLAVLDVGAYGFAMSSNYNARLRPAEVLVTPEGDTRVIREREELSYLLLNQRY